MPCASRRTASLSSRFSCSRIDMYMPSCWGCPGKSGWLDCAPAIGRVTTQKKPLCADFCAACDRFGPLLGLGQRLGLVHDRDLALVEKPAAGAHDRMHVLGL